MSGAGTAGATETKKEKEKEKKVRPTDTAKQPANDGGQIPSSKQQQADEPAAGAREQQRAMSSLDIQLVQNLIERCLQLYMNKREVLSIIEQQAKIAPSFTGLVWKQLQEQNPDFFKAYYGRLRLKDQIVVFNQLIERHYHMLRSNPQATLQIGNQPQAIGVREQQQSSQEQQMYDQQQGDAVVLRDEDHRQRQARDGMRGSTDAVPTTAGDVHGELGGMSTMVQALRSAAHGDGVSAKDTTFNDFNAGAGLSSVLPSENDGLMGGTNTFPRNFSLSDLTMDLQQENDGEPSLNLLENVVGPSETTGEEIKRNFSFSDVNLEL